MMEFENREYFADQLTGKDEAKKSGRGKATALAVVIIMVLGLALGLGLGLGLRKSSPEQEAAGCRVERQFPEELDNIKQRIKDGRSSWDRSTCPSPGRATCPDGVDEPPLFLISLDGFRADYLLHEPTPNIQHLVKCGVHAKYMRGMYPTKTFPNHYSLVTGLYPESHGLVDNTMYDPEMEVLYRRQIDEIKLNPKWYHGEPVWNTMMKAGMKAAVYNWAGSDVKIQDMRPEICYNYDPDWNIEDRISEVIGMVRTRSLSDFPDLTAIYIEEPDKAGHDGGPYSDWVRGNLTRVDNLIGVLLDELAEKNLQDCVNLVVLADHEDPQVTLSKLECVHYNSTKDYWLKFYEKKDLPVRFHYAASDRIDDIVVDVGEDFLFSRDGRTSNDDCNGGDHGYDGNFKSMHSLFVASGPAFKQDEEVDPFDNIEVMNLLTDVLGIQSPPNNGTQGSLRHLLAAELHTEPLPDPASGYGFCPLTDDSDWNDRREASDCNSIIENIDELDRRLNLNAEDVAEAKSRHAPLGVAELDFPDANACELIHTDYISGFSHQQHMPVWSSFRLSQQAAGRADEGYEGAEHARPDVRLDIEQQVDCTSFEADDISPVYLYPSEFSDETAASDARLSTNLVPMYDGFKDGIWKASLDLLKEYAEKYSDIYVTLGPLFDWNSDGLADDPSDFIERVGSGDVPMPSHYFVSATRCEDEALSMSECMSQVSLINFILPHRPALTNCWHMKIYDYQMENMARLRDLELMSGLRLLPELEPVDLRIRKSISLPTGLWDRLGWLDAFENEDTCPDVSQTQCPNGFDADHPPVLLLSIDGFRPDYLERGRTPFLKKLTECGTTTDYMRSIYPTMTFPNHYTIVTGLYPESHGIVDNSMFDMKLNQSFYLGGPNTFNPGWWDGDPIWNLVTNSNKTSMTVMWPGSEVEIHGTRPDRFYFYDGNIPYHERVDQILRWLDNSEGRLPDFMTLYFSKVDSEGHEGGPDSVELNDALEFTDIQVRRLMDGIYRRGLHTCFNFIIISDHGMSDISCDRVELLKDHLSPEQLNKLCVYPGTAGRASNKYTCHNYNYVVLKPEERVPMEDLVDALECQYDNMFVYDKHDLPRRHHFINHDRIDDLQTLVADRWQQDRVAPWCNIIGQHGFDPRYETMKSYFLAIGPAFHTRLEVRPFENIELYNLMCDVLGLEAPPNNGTEGSLYHLMRRPPPLPMSTADDVYGVCSYPEDEDDYERRANLTVAGCDCTPPQESSIRSWDERLNLTSESVDNFTEYHAPHGIPTHYNHSLCQLTHPAYVSGYSHDLKMPAWSMITLTPSNIQSAEHTEDQMDCVRPDVRLEPDEQLSCTDFAEILPENVSKSFLIPPSFMGSGEAVYDALLLTNIVPMYTGFREGIWTELIKLISEYVNAYNTVHVMLGPIFDHNADGLRDNVYNELKKNYTIPSHYYAIVLKCPDDNDLGCIDMDYDIQAYILPHQKKTFNCADERDAILNNLGRIRDIELLTGLEFLTANVTQTSLERRTYTPMTFWQLFN